jgi:hypothetical protein
MRGKKRFFPKMQKTAKTPKFLSVFAAGENVTWGTVIFYEYSHHIEAT